MGPDEKNILRFAICEDDDSDAKALRDIVTGAYACEAVRFSSGESFWSSDPAGRFDVVLMDVFLGGATGVDVSRKLRAADDRVEIVFVTSSEDHALDGYAVNAAQYVVKPFDRERIEAVLEGVVRRLEAMRGEVLSITENRRRRNLPLRDILYVAADGPVCTIRTRDEHIRTYLAIEALAAALPPPRFLRCHRAYVVNLDHVRYLEDGDFVMSDGERVYISVKNFRKVKSAYEERLFERARRGGA